MIYVKRVYEKSLITDGKMVLVERLWPRGIRRNTPNVDIWFKNVAPSTELRKWFNHDPKKWMQFKKKYVKELENGNKAVEQLLNVIISTDPVTLVYSAKDQRHNSALVLQHYLEVRLRKEARSAMKHVSLPKAAMHSYRTAY